MIKQTKIRKIGNSEGVVLPKSVLESLNWQNGDAISVVPQGNGILLTVSDPDFQEVMGAYAEMSKKYADVLKELAK
jgi:putative addiction module antidote